VDTFSVILTFLDIFILIHIVYIYIPFVLEGFFCFSQILLAFPGCDVVG
jgi:hypothetical protein